MTDITATIMKKANGRIIFLMMAFLTGGSVFSLIRWNQSFSAVLVLGYITLAQENIGAYFESDIDDDMHNRIVYLLSFGYCLLFTICIWRWNEFVGGELLAGLMLFIRRICKGYFNLPIVTLKVLTPPGQPPEAVNVSATINAKPMTKAEKIESIDNPGEIHLS